jgi:hypothetical protein
MTGMDYWTVLLDKVLRNYSEKDLAKLWELFQEPNTAAVVQIEYSSSGDTLKAEIRIEQKIAK